MKRFFLICAMGVAGSLYGMNWAEARYEDDLKLSQTTPDMVPLLDSLRDTNEPETVVLKQHKLSEQAVRELAHFRTTALAPPMDDAQRAAAGQSAWMLGLLYLHGAGVPANSAKAKQWFTLGGHYGEPMARAGLAWCAYEGCQSSANWAQAQHWTQQLMLADPARAYYMQWLLERQLRPLNPNANEGVRSLTAAERDLLDRAVSGGNVHAMIDLGILYAQVHDWRHALALFEDAAAQSDVANQNAIWVRQHMRMENQIPRSSSKAQVSLAKAEALFRLARKYHRGDGISVNYVEAIRLYRQADSAGSPSARRMLSLIYSRTTPDGALDPSWMRQLSGVDVASLVPKQENTLSISALRKEPTPLIDLVPRAWLRMMD